MAWYRAGTVSCAQNSTTVTGTNTLFTVNCRVGDGFIGPDGANNEVVNIVSDAQLTLAQPYKGPSANNQAYAIIPVQGYNKAAADALRAVLRQMDSVTESEQQAGASRDAAAQSATAAGQSATAAQQSASSASTSKDAAAQSASAASGSATAAGQSATAASSSKDAAAQSATAAAQSATSADTSAKAAAQSASSAEQSASAADSSAKSAASAAAGAVADKLSLSGGRMTGALDLAPIVNVASAATTPIAAAKANSVNVTGTTTITAFDTPSGNAIGVTRQLTFMDALTLTHSTNLIMPGGVNQTTAAGDVAAFEHLGGGAWRCVRYQRADSPPFRSTQSTTDATVGRQVKVGDFGVGGQAPAATDANALPAVNGKFRLQAGTANNSPDGVSFWTIDQYIFDNERTQFATREGNTDLTMYYRKYGGGVAAWSPWTPNVLAGSPLLGGYKNKILNGSFWFNTRQQASYTVPASGVAYTLDQWLLSPGAGGSETIQNIGAQMGFRSSTTCARWTKGSVGGTGLLRQWIENVSTLHGRTATLSFYAKWATTGFTSPMYVQMHQVFGTNGSAQVGINPVRNTGGSTSNPGQFTPTTGWQKFSFTFNIPSISDKTLGTTAHFLQLVIGCTNTAAFTLDIAEIQLEEGPVATDFERRPVGEEQAALARYLQQVAVNGRFTAAAAGAYYNASHNWPTMRAVPTLQPLINGSAANYASFSMGATNPSGGRLELVAAAAGDCYFISYTYLAVAEI